MPQLVNIEGFGKVHFPDDFTPEQIRNAIENDILKNASQQAAAIQRKAGEMALEGMPMWERAAAGAGKKLYDTGRGIKQLFSNNANQAQIDETQQRDAALMDDPAALTGYIGGALAETILPGAAVVKGARAANMARAADFGNALAGGARTYKGAAATGAGISGIQPVASDESRATNMGVGAVGGTVGRGLTGLVGRAARPVRGDDRLSIPQQEILAEAERIGMQVPAGVKTGSTPLRQLEASMESFPMTSGPFQRAKIANQRLLNQEGALNIGEVAPDLGPRTLDSAFTRIEDVYSRLASKKAVDVGPSLSQPLGKVLNEFDGLTTSPIRDNPLFKKAMEIDVDGTATREELLTLASKLGQRASSEMRSASGDRQLGIALFRTKEAIDDVVMNALPKSQQKELAKTRQQYRNLMTMLESGAINESSGDLSGRKLATALARKDRKGFTRGQDQSDLYSVARFAEAFPSVVGDSGTATRNVIPYLIAGGTTLAGGLAGGYGGAPVEGAAAGLSIPLAAMLASRGYMTQPVQKWLSGGYAPQLSPAGSRVFDLLSRGTLSGSAAGAPLLYGGQ